MRHFYRQAVQAVGGLLLVLVSRFNASVAADAQHIDDHPGMMSQLGIRKLRPGASPNDPETYNESKASRYDGSLPDALLMKEGTRVTRADQWPQRRAELVERGASAAVGNVHLGTGRCPIYRSREQAALLYPRAVVIFCPHSFTPLIPGVQKVCPLLC
jgi:hypothetical protein